MGCDWVLDSNAVEDECGICKGDGTQCKIIEDMFASTIGHGKRKLKSLLFTQNLFYRLRKSGDNTEGS